MNRAPFSFDVSYFPLVLGQELAKSDLSQVDVYSLLGELLDDDLSHADYIIEITAAEQKVALALDVPVGSSHIRMTRVAFMMSGKPVDFEYVYGRPDSYRFKYVFHDGEEYSRLRILHRGVGAVRNCHKSERSWQGLPLIELPVKPPAPAMQLQEYEGEAFDLEKYLGRIVVVNFWAT